MSEGERGTNKTSPDPVKEQIAQDKFGKSYDELTAHERVRVGGTKGGITKGVGNYAGHYQGEGSHTEVAHTGDKAADQGIADVRSEDDVVGEEQQPDQAADGGEEELEEGETRAPFCMGPK